MLVHRRLGGPVLAGFLTVAVMTLALGLCGCGVKKLSSFEVATLKRDATTALSDVRWAGDLQGGLLPADQNGMVDTIDANADGEVTVALRDPAAAGVGLDPAAESSLQSLPQEISHRILDLVPAATSVSVLNHRGEVVVKAQAERRR